MTNYNDLADTARVWIYQSKTPLPTQEITAIRQHLSDFASTWVSHNNQLKAYAEVFHNQFIVLMVDESQAGASGCSIDKSVRFVQQLEQKYQLDLFDRMTFTYKEGDTIKTAHRTAFAALYKSGAINEATLVFDNLVKTKAAFENNWIKPLGESWHKRMV